MSDPGWSWMCCCSGPQGFSTLLLGSYHNGEENLSPPSQLTSWVFWRSIWEHRCLHLTFTSSMHMHLTERPPQSPALLQGEPLSWLPSQDEDGSLSSLTAKEQHYVPEKKEGLWFALIYRFIYLEKSIQHKVFLSCVITLDATRQSLLSAGTHHNSRASTSDRRPTTSLFS